MTAEEQFEDWWVRIGRQIYGKTCYQARKETWLMAHRLGKKQGMEESAKICDYREELQNKTCGDEREIEARCCAEAIRQAAEEIK